MTQMTKNLLSCSLEPLCPRDDLPMRFEAHGILWSDGPGGKEHSLPSYHCSCEGCCVRYDLKTGYFTVVKTPDQPYFIEEPGVNLWRCPQHGTWLYRSETHDADSRCEWRGGVEDCDHTRSLHQH